MTKIIEVKMRSMKIAKMLVAAVATLFVTSPVWAQDTLHLTLDDALKVALSENNSVKVADINAFLEKILRLEKSAKLDIIGRIPERAHTICTGLALFLTVAQKTGALELTVTDASVRDGYLEERLKLL